ncbi:hypothetical protein Tco_1561607 [Tanacetum coccineum]
MENANRSSLASPICQRVRELNKILESLDMVVPPLISEPCCLEGELRFDIWMALGGITRDLGSIGEETDKTTTLHRGLLKNSVQCLKTASQFPRDAVISYKQRRQDLHDGIIT